MDEGKVRTLLLSSCLIFACGAEDESGPGLHIPPLSATPGCYEAPPVPFEPMGILATSASCIHTYEPIVEEMRSHPHETSWSITSRQLTTKTFQVQEGSRVGTQGHFSIQISSAQEASDGECPQSEFAFGQYGEGFAEIEQIDYTVVWTDSMVGSAVPTPPFGKLIVFLLGCDPVTGVSYGQIPRDDHDDPLLEEGTSCWKSGAFVSCEGSNIWPFPE